jgi:hypothetical protein
LFRQQGCDLHEVVGEHGCRDPQLKALATFGETALHAATAEQHRDTPLDAGAKALAILEFPAFPARDLSTELGVRLLGELAQSDELSSLPAFAPERLATTARLFLDLVAVPMLLRALFEVNLKVLDAEIDAHVARSVLPRSVAKTAA